MAAMSSKTFEIDGVTYKTTLLPATTGRHIYLRLIKVVGPALEALDQPKADNALVLASFLVRMFDSVDTVLLDELCETFGAVTVMPRPGGEDPLTSAHFGVHFAGRYRQMVQWLVECIRANGMIDFLSDLSSLGKSTEASPKSA